MKFAVLFAVISAVDYVWAECGFEPGKTYTYQYDARIGTGVQNPGSFTGDQQVEKFLGRGYTATIIIQLDSGKLYFKISVPGHGRVQEVDNLRTVIERGMKVAELSAVHKAPFEKGSDLKTVEFKKATHKLSDKLDFKLGENPAEVLSFIPKEFDKPFWADYETGVIKSFYFPSGTTVPAMNNKKAIAALFQLNLEPLRQNRKDSYSVNENGINGECPTSYNVAHDPENDVLNVTKVRSHDDCSDQSNTSPIICHQKKMTTLSRAASINYVLKGTAKNYSIEKIDHGGVVTVSTVSSNDTIVYVVNQTLTLVKVEQKSTPLPPSGQEEKHNFKFTFKNPEEEPVQHKRDTYDETKRQREYRVNKRSVAVRKDAATEDDEQSHTLSRKSLELGSGKYRRSTGNQPQLHYKRVIRAWVQSNTSFILRDVYLRQAINGLGYEFDVLEVGVVGVLMDQFEKRSIKNVQSLLPKERHLKKVDEVSKNIFMEQNQRSADNDGLLGGDDIKLQSFLAVKENLDELKKRVVQGVKEIIRKNRFSFNDVQCVVNNEMGLPVILSLKKTEKYKIGGTGGSKTGIKDESNDIKVDLRFVLGLSFEIRANVAV